MNCSEHRINGVSFLEVEEDGVIISNTQDLLDIVSDYSVKKIIVKKQNVCDAFYDLRTGFAAELAQKARNYKISLGIIGDFDAIDNKGLRDFIYESNRERQLLFKGTIKEIVRIMCK